MDRNYLVMLDISGIHDYIFGTNKLREIRGASILLDRLNRKKAIDELKSYGDEGQEWESVVAGGGNIKVIFDKKGYAEKYVDFLKRLFYDDANGVDVTVTLCEKKDSWSEGEWISHSERQLQKDKLVKERKRQNLSSGYFKSCQACGIFPAEVEVLRDRFVCNGCFQKINESKYYKNMEVYNRLVKSIDMTLKLPNEFGDIGKQSHPQGYIGFIYADGNRMGEHLEKIKRFNELKEFSKNVEEATFEAVVTTIKNHFGNDFTFQIILAGGDDLIMVVPAHKAISMAIDFCDEFNQMLKEYNGTDSVTTSAAVVLCHDSVPIKNVLESAEGLLRNAKIRSRKNSDVSYIDFTATTGSTLGDPISRRKKELEYLDNGEISLTMRPYSLEAMCKILENIRNLKKDDFPKNKLKTLYTSIFNGYFQGTIEALYMKTRLADAHCESVMKIERDFGVDKFPWKTISANKYETPFEDMIELYEFIQLEDEA